MFQVHTMETFTEIDVTYVYLDVHETAKNQVKNCDSAALQSGVYKLLVYILRF